MNRIEKKSFCIIIIIIPFDFKTQFVIVCMYSFEYCVHGSKEQNCMFSLGHETESV